MDTRFSKYFAGDIGVEIFFVISGFLITSLLIKEKIVFNKISLKRFYIRRLFRILPVAYLYLLTLLLLSYFSVLKVDLKSFLSAAFFYQNIPFIKGDSWYVGHFWSLSVEEQFYILFPFLLVTSINKYIKVVMCLIVFIPIIAFLGYTNTGAFYTNHLLHAAAFVIINLFGKTVCILIGSFAAILLFKGVVVIKSTSSNRYLSFVLFIIAVLIHTEKFILPIPYCGLFVFPSLIATVIVLNLNPFSFFTQLLSNPIIRFIGLISYSIYIWQQLFLLSTDSVLTSSKLINIAGALGVASISYYFFEKPMLKLRRRFADGG